MPDIEMVSAEIITEWEFPKLSPSGQTDIVETKDAFEAAGGDF